MTLGKCPYSARWLHWGLPSPEQISGTCAAFLAGLPQVSPTTAPCSVGHIPRRLRTGLPWPKQLPGSPGSLPDQGQGPRAKVSRWACLALNCCAASWSRCQVGEEWAGRGGRLCFHLLWVLFCLCHHRSCCYSGSHGPTCFTGCPALIVLNPSTPFLCHRLQWRLREVKVIAQGHSWGDGSQDPNPGLSDLGLGRGPGVLGPSI